MRSIAVFAAALCLGAAGAQAAEFSLQNNGRYGPVPFPGDGALRLVEEQVTIHFGKTSSTVSIVSRFANGLEASFKGLVVIPDPALGWQAFEAEQGRLPPEKRFKWTDPDNPYYLFPYTPLRNPLRVGGDFTAALSEEEILVEGRAIPLENVSHRVVVSTDTTWTMTEKGKGFPMRWRRIPVEAAPGAELVLERRFRARNTAYLGGAEVQLFDYEVLAGRGASPERLSVTVHLQGGLTIKDLKWKGLNQSDLRHIMPAREAWNVLDERTLRLYWAHPYRNLERNLIRLALDTEWVTAPPGGAAVHSRSFKLVRILKTPKDAPPVVEATREYFAETFRIVVYPSASISEEDLRRLRRRKIKPGSSLEVQGVRVTHEEIAVNDGAKFKIQ